MNDRELFALKNKYDIVGNDPAWNRALEIAVAIAPTDLTAIIYGESGAGKEVFPKIIHDRSLRKNGKFFAVNCGAIPEGTVDSELFGHEKGAFTGAIETRKGYFEEADGGTLFLDEIAELPLTSQAKLLRVLQSGEFIRVGSSKVLKTNVRVIAATNVDLMGAVSRGKFRADLYYRLNSVPVNIPALRDRREDIDVLFRKFTADFSARNSMANVKLTEDALVMLKNYRWPGNIRQLKAVADAVSAIESVKMTPGMSRVEIDSTVLAKYLPHDESQTIPVLYEPTRGEQMSSDEREMIIRTIFTLRQEVDRLNSVVFASGAGAGAPMPSLPGVAVRHDDGFVEEPDEQVSMESPQAQQVQVPATISDMTESMIRTALSNAKTVKEAAAMLGMSERNLYRKRKELNIK
ncbi:MAG: sigma 54-interacting transcriptional regulator [Bacteroidales bacterium]|nr:sigma 54-interacting transcriptional regulator [Bacteroidales bacterium]